jgi:prepilin-type N-terminal cleavage/methylation domain-containing protein
MRRAFTLLEVVVSLVLVVGIAAFTFGSLRGTFAMRDFMEKQDATDRSARVALNKIERELRMAFLTKNTQAINTYRPVFVGKNNGDIDTLWFATFAHRRMYYGTPEGDQTEITIWAEGSDDGKSSILFHRESARIDEDPDAGGTILPLASGVVKFDLDFLSSQTGEWMEEWDSTGTEQHKLPRAVQILLVLQGPDPDDDDEVIEHTYVTTVMLDTADPINKDQLTSGSGAGSGTGSGSGTGGPP